MQPPKSGPTLACCPCKGWGQLNTVFHGSDQTRDIHSAFSSNSGHKHQHRPQLQQDHRPIHDHWQQARPGAHHNFLIQACSSPPSSWHLHLSSQWMNSMALLPVHLSTTYSHLSVTHLSIIVAPVEDAWIAPIECLSSGCPTEHDWGRRFHKSF